MSPRARLLVSAVVAAVLFTLGYFIAVVVPGAGTVTPQEFIDFYAEEGNQSLTLMFALALLAGALAMVWFFNEVRARVPETTGTRVGYAAAIVGLVGVAAGGVVVLAPIGVQLNSGADFVGVEIAHTFAQAGLGLMLVVGMYSLALATVLFSVAFRRSAVVPSWLAIAGIVVAVLMLGSYVWAPGLLFPLWVLTVGAVGLRGYPAT
jgi:hypothetical protein